MRQSHEDGKTKQRFLTNGRRELHNSLRRSEARPSSSEIGRLVPRRWRWMIVRLSPGFSAYLAREHSPVWQSSVVHRVEAGDL